MKLTVLILAIVVATAAAGRICYSNRGEKLVQFNGRKQDLLVPCKYPALRRQQCGDWLMTVSPGNMWVYPKYQLDTLWLGLNNTKTGGIWEGRTTNKKAVKYLNTEGIKDLFERTDGDIETLSVFEFGRDDGVRVYIQDKEETFRVSFTPWDPSNRADFPNSDFEVECNDNSAVLNPYPDQFCGSEESSEVKTRYEEVFDLPGRFRALQIYYDLFTNAEIVHNNPQCDVAVDIILNKCQSDEQVKLALVNCMDILHSQRHTECITTHHCDPMEVFNACLEWGCTGAGFEKAEKDLCAAVAEGIDFCNTLENPGNLSDRVAAANCYKNFISIDTGIVHH